MKKISCLLISLTFLCFSLPLMATDLPTESSFDKELQINIDPTMTIESQSKSETIKVSNTTIDATYPQIKSQTPSAKVTNFNKMVLEKVNKEISQFKQYVNEDLAHQKTLAKSVQNNSLSIDYDIDVIHPGKLTLIMVRFNIEGMQAGRAHPYHVHRVMNFDLEKGKELALADLFKPNSDFLKKISDYSRKQLIASNLPSDWVKKGTEANSKNFQTWNIQDDTLLITFDEYQVGPYVNGPQEVEIPYAELANIIEPTSVVSCWVDTPKSCEVG